MSTGPMSGCDWALPRTSTKQRTEQAHHTAVVPHIADGCDVGGPHKAFPRWDQLVHIVRCVHSSHTPPCRSHGELAR